jgi:mRNA-degrading endonuclease toxin of MazEF toxin-antitoxin module
VTQYKRGMIYHIDYGLTNDQGRAVPKYLLVVSNNGRNRSDSALAVRITSSHYPVDSRVQIDNGNPFAGSYIDCDDVIKIYDEDLVGTGATGAVMVSMMRKVEEGLRVALGMS